MSIPRRHTLCTVLLMIFAGASLAAQTPDPRLVGRLSPAAVDSVTALAARAAARGLPVEPLIQKALEGQSKSAEDRLILSAVHDLLDRLERASAALGDRAKDSDMVAAAGAMHLGVSAMTLRDVVAAYRDQSLAVPLVVLTDMIRKGVAVETASSVIVQLVEARVDVDGLQRFRRLVDRDINSGAAPADAATIRARGALLERQRGLIPSPTEWPLVS